jgi:hypothetical protein
MNTQTFYHTLKTNFYVPVPFQYDYQLCTDAIHSFFDFLRLPVAYNAQFKGKISTVHRRGELGLWYREKTADADYKDQKCFFHYHPLLLKTYQTEINQTSEAMAFFKMADLLWHEVYMCLQNVLSKLEIQYEGITDSILNTDTIHLVLRFLRYDIRTVGDVLAAPHFDAGAMTFAIAESKPGLRIGSGPHDLKLVQHKNKEALFFVSGNFAQLVDDNNLKPGWHDVVCVDDRPKDNQYERWAIVAFIDGHSTMGAPESLTHKWRVNTKLL